ncbi:MAG: hypothetical protein WC223_10755 [Bacteroidales bacterium]|jgi:hypothetical protein
METPISIIPEITSKIKNVFSKKTLNDLAISLEKAIPEAIKGYTDYETQNRLLFSYNRSDLEGSKESPSGGAMHFDVLENNKKICEIYYYIIPGRSESCGKGWLFHEFFFDEYENFYNAKIKENEDNHDNYPSVDDLDCALGRILHTITIYWYLLSIENK